MSEVGIVTPEAVVLAFETAGVGSRLVAAVIDLVAQAAAAFVLLIAFAAFGHTPLGLAGVFFGMFVILFGYPVAIETLWRGRSLGKAAMGLRVTTVEGAPIRFRHALVRGALGLVDFWLTSGAVAVLAVLLTRRNQRLGDIAAGTLVLRERTGARQPWAATFAVPPGWEAYAATLDVSGLSAADYQAVRALLLRAATLDPWTRDRLARDIATPLLTRLRHQPPPGVSAEGFLLCVAALYQRRQRRLPGGGGAVSASGVAVPWAGNGAEGAWHQEPEPQQEPPAERYGWPYGVQPQGAPVGPTPGQGWASAGPTPTKAGAAGPPGAPPDRRGEGVVHQSSSSGAGFVAPT